MTDAVIRVSEEHQVIVQQDVIRVIRVSAPASTGGGGGTPGVGVQSAVVNGTGHLIVTLTDATVIDTGYVVGPQGIQGPQGVQGIQGVQGNAGANGTNGSTVLNGAGAPGNGTGANGDFYVDTTNNRFYGPKAAGVWAGFVSIVGPQGVQGVQGVQGNAGANGADGRTLLNGAGAPAAGTGANGDFYLDTTAKAIYGPKAAGAWGAGTSLIGPQGTAGTNGTNGTNGNTVLNGAGAPAAGTGVDGDFYIRTSNWNIYGPKTAGAWGASTSLVGPQGATGAAGADAPATYTSASTPPGVNEDTAHGYAVGSRGVVTTTGQFYVCRSAANGAAVWNRMDSADHPGYVSGRWYPTIQVSLHTSSGVFSASTARFAPFEVQERVTITDLAAWIQTASAGGKFQLAIYASDLTTKYPTGTPLTWTGDLSTTTGTTLVSGTLTGNGGNVTLEPGNLYYLASSCDNATASFQMVSTADNTFTFMNGSATLANLNVSLSSAANQYFTAYTYANGLSSLNMTAVTPTENATYRGPGIGYFKVQ